MSTKTLEIPGTMKTIRAIRDLEYRGKIIVGRRKVRIDHKFGAYEETLNPGETAVVEQTFAKEVVMSGLAELLEGGMCEVVAEKDGFHRYTDWRRKPEDPVPIYERVEFLKAGGMPGGPYWQAGFKCRLDITTFWDRSRVCYEDQTATDQHSIRILKPSPIKVKMNAIELATRVGVMWKKLYPDTPTAAT
jgi:hypothetical protein